MSFNDFTMLPADDPQTAAADDLNAAIAGAVALPDQITPVAAPAPTPFGNSWLFDWDQGQFVRVGKSPAQTADFATLNEWIQMAIHAARYAHPVFSDAFGMEEPDDIIGEFADGEALQDWQAALVDAILVHDRVTAVQNVSLDWDPATGNLTIVTMDVITDQDETIQVSDVTLQAGGA